MGSLAMHSACHRFVLHRDRRCADRGDAVQRLLGGIRWRLGGPQRVHHRDFGFTVFSVGYVAMARRVTAAGGFYSFASHGFGQTIGMGVALLIAACYLIFRPA